MENIVEAPRMLNKDNYTLITQEDLPTILKMVTEILPGCGGTPYKVKDLYRTNVWIANKNSWSSDRKYWGRIDNFEIENNQLYCLGIKDDKWDRVARDYTQAPFKMSLDDMRALPLKRSDYGRGPYAYELLKALKTAVDTLKKQRKPDVVEAHAHNIEELAKIVLESPDCEADKRWLETNITGIVFNIPMCSGDEAEVLGDSNIGLTQKWKEREEELLSRFHPELIPGEDFEYRDAAKEAEHKEDWYSRFWNFACTISFKEPINIEALPIDIKDLIEEAKKLSMRVGKGRYVDFEYENSTTISSYYLGCAICRIFGSFGSYNASFYKKPAEEPKPEEPTAAEIDNPFEQDFDAVNAYGEKVECLHEAKEETCCICGEPIQGYGNNPEPYKHEGRCCDACNMKFVIPARLKLMQQNESLTESAHYVTDHKGYSIYKDEGGGYWCQRGYTDQCWDKDFDSLSEIKDYINKHYSDYAGEDW